ncbi:amidase family protein [Janibacter sp. CX7]|uniref:amidase family protein n=1 Tax=Janibacter sp. CX7 TaxID=2963431 RepID=UPI0020CE5CF7|nr:amidase family protein [Janibacter sp. CX7]UTT66524.1 amidase family protein [Janibacter sp. CX7]
MTVQHSQDPGLGPWIAAGSARRRSMRRRARETAAEEQRTHHAWISVGDELPEGGGRGGPLDGIPFAVKDNIDVAGFTTTAGSPLLEHQRPVLDADVVSLLRQAGAVVLGKTNLHELAFGGTSNNRTHGAVRNPVDPTRVAGGSSGGSAAAVALGSVPFALGTDTGGSVTVPSAFCGVVGFRPTTGRYPGTGVVNLSTSRDTVGLHTRCVRDVRLVDRVIAPSARPAPPPDLSEVVLGLVPSRFDDLQTEVAQALDGALELLRQHGVTFVDVQVPGDLAVAGGAGLDLVFYEAARLLPARFALGPGPGSVNLVTMLDRIASPDVRALVEHLAACGLSAADYEAARLARAELRRAYGDALAASGAHALVGPTSPVLPPPIGADDVLDVDGRPAPTFATIIRNAGPGSVAGVPMLSLPAGTSASGLPVGLCLEGVFFADDDLLALGESLEAGLP